MRVKIVLLGKGFELQCPKCNHKRYMDNEDTVNKCYFCADEPFEVDLISINQYGLYEAIPK